VLRSVDMRPEGHPLIGHLRQPAQAEHLESTGIGQNRSIPAHESVQSAHPPDRLMTRPQVEVIRIAQQDSNVEIFEQILRDSLDGSLRSHRHEHGGFHRPMGQPHRRQPTGSMALSNLKSKRHLLIVATSQSSISRTPSRSSVRHNQRVDGPG
jgi:hypothetical protein